MFDDAEVIHTYTRAQALDDGVLIDISEVAAEAGWKYPVAITSTAWADCVAWDRSTRGGFQDENGRLWDVVWMARVHAQLPNNSDRVTFHLYRVPNRDDACHPQLVSLVAVCGPGDTADPVVTIMLPGDD